MTINAIVQFLIMAREHTNAKNLIDDFEHLIGLYKFDYYGILSQPRPHQDPLSLVLAGRWPEGWPEAYIGKKLVLVDPTIRYLLLAEGGFRWRDSLKFLSRSPQIRRMGQMLKEARKFGLEDGYIFPVHSRRGLIGNLTMGGSSAVEMSEVEISLFEQVAKLMYYELMRFSLKGSENEDDPTLEEVSFTRRELEVMHFLAEGLTSQEIAKILKISNHTVDWYMNNIQEKLGARNRQHTVALAFKAGFIS